MEGEKGVFALVILGTAVVVLLAIFVVIMFLIYQRKMYAKQTVIDLLENECKLEIRALKKEMKALEEKVNRNSQV